MNTQNPELSVVGRIEAMPELPEPRYYWEPTPDSGFSPSIAGWSTNTGPAPAWNVTHYYTADQMHALTWLHEQIAGRKGQRHKLDGTGQGYIMLAKEEVLDFIDEAIRKAAIQTNEQGRAADAMPLMMAAFRTTSTCGPDKLYEMRFAFRDIETLHAADDEWRKFSGLSK